MRVLPTRPRSTRRLDRGGHPVPRPPAATPAEPPGATAADHPHERRARESGGPIDHAQYSCACGMVFQAAVSTSVRCPHCGSAQAW
jgi:hypothetical protein